MARISGSVSVEPQAGYSSGAAGFWPWDGRVPTCMLLMLRHELLARSCPRVHPKDPIT